MSRPRATQHLGAGPIRRPQLVNTRLVVWGSNPPVTTTDGRRRRQQSQPTRPGEPRQRSPADPVQHPFPEQRQDASTASLTTPPALNTTETNTRLYRYPSIRRRDSDELVTSPPPVVLLHPLKLSLPPFLLHYKVIEPAVCPYNGLGTTYSRPDADEYAENEYTGLPVLNIGILPALQRLSVGLSLPISMAPETLRRRFDVGRVDEFGRKGGLARVRQRRV
jgi:hypothetical protein